MGYIIGGESGKGAGGRETSDVTGQSLTQRYGKGGYSKTSSSSPQEYYGKQYEKMAQTSGPTRQEYYNSYFKKLGYSTTIGPSGEVIATKGNRKLIVDAAGRYVNVPYTAKYNTSQFAMQPKLSTYDTRLLQTFKKVGYTGKKDRLNNLTLTGRGEKLFLQNKYDTFTTKTLTRTPLSAKISKYQPSTKSLKRAESRETQKRYEKTLIGKLDMLTKFPRDLFRPSVRGAKNLGEMIYLASKSYPKSASLIYNLFNKATQVKYATEKFNKTRRSKELYLLKRATSNYINTAKKIKFNENYAKLKPIFKRMGELSYNTKTGKVNPDTLEFYLTSAAFLGGGLGSMLSKTIATGLTGYGLYLTGQSAVKTAKKPTLENIGETLFYGGPTALGFLRGMRKLGISNKANVSNARLVRAGLKAKLIRYSQEYKMASKIREDNAFRVKKALKKEIPKIKKAINNLDKVLKDKEVLKLTDFNPKIPSKYLKQYQGAYKELYHVSGEANINKMLGQKKTQVIAQKKINNLLKKVNIKQPKSLKDLKPRGKIESFFIDIIKKNDGIIYGGKAISLYTSKIGRLLLRRKKTVDFDVFMKNAKVKVKNIVNKLNIKFKTKDFTYKPAVHKGTYKIFYKNKNISDISELEKGVKFVKTPKGLKIRIKPQELEAKIYASIERQYNLKPYKNEKIVSMGKVKLSEKAYKDLKDVMLLSNFKITKNNIYNVFKNPRNIFEIVERPGTGQVGKSRKLFKEFFLFTDLEAAKGYGYGKKPSILIFKEKIGLYPKKLRKLIDLASAGKLSQKQSISLRKKLVSYAKLNIEKFRPGTRTLSMTSGEREFINAAGAKFKRIGKFTTFDNDFKKFMQVAYMNRNLRSTKTGLFQKILKAYSKNPFTRLKLRLTNPDYLKVKRYYKLLNNNISLSKFQKMSFLEIFKKVFSGKKAQYKSTFEDKSLYPAFNKIFKNNKIAMSTFEKKVIKLSDIRRKTIMPSKFKARTVISKTRELNRQEVGNLRKIIDFGRIRDREIARNPMRVILRISKRLPVKARLAKRINRKKAREIKRTTTRRNIQRQRARIARPTFVPRRPGRSTIRKIITPTRTPKKIIDSPNEEKGKSKNIILNAKKKGMFIYLADLLSILYNKRATPKQAKALKLVGRLFTGFESRPIIG